MTSVDVQITATTTRVHVTPNPPRHHSTARIGALFSWHPGHGKILVRRGGQPQDTRALLRRLWMAHRPHDARHDMYNHTTTELDTRARKRRLQARALAWTASKNQTILDDNGWNMVAKPAVEDQREGAGGSSNHQPVSMSPTRVLLDTRFVGTCAITSLSDR